MIPKIVQHAMVNTVIDIGRLSKVEIRILNAYVKKGYLSKGKGGQFPKIKTVWACPGFDFIADRKAQIKYLLSL